MPTYDYQCGQCQHSFEHFQGINDPPLKTCPSCKRRKLRRLFGTGAAIVFKGSGFYQTDYRSESYKKGAEAAKKSSEGPADSKNQAKKSEKSSSTTSETTSSAKT